MDGALTPVRALVVCVLLLGLSGGRAAAQPLSGTPRTIFIPVLTYHHIKWTKPTDDAIERGLTVWPAQFDAQLRYLAAGGYHTVTAAQLVSYLSGGRALPPKPVVLTFDDGYNDVYANAFAVLQRRRMRATFFIVPGFLGRTRYLTWQSVETMSSHGMDIEAHSMTHPDLTTVPLLQLRGEVRQSRTELQNRLHRSVRIFCYPYGAYNAAVLREVTRAGYLAAFTTHQGWIAQRAALLTLPRVAVDSDDSLAVFAGRLTADPRVLAQDPT